MIDGNVYRAIFRSKKARIFVVFIQNLKYQAEKKDGQETDSKTVVPADYHDSSDIFSKKNLTITPPYEK